MSWPLVPVDGKTADWPRKVATAVNRLQNTAFAASGTATWGSITGTLSAQTDLNSALGAKQATLVSGTNLKTVNGTTLLGAGDLSTVQTTITGNAGTATALQTGRTFAMTGDVAWTTGAFDGTANITAVGTIQAGVVTLAKMADVATGTVFYRKTAGAGAPEVQTLATLKTDLGLTGTNSGDQTSIVGITGTLAEFNAALTGADFATGGGTASGTNTGDQTITLTGDVTGSGTGSFATTIAAGAVNLTTKVTGTLPVANGGTGTATAFTAGSVVFAGAAGVYSQDNVNLFWDDTNNRLGVGTTVPGYGVDVASAGIRGSGGTSSITTVVAAGGLSYKARAGADIATFHDFDAPDISTVTVNYRYGRATNSSGTSTLNFHNHDGTASIRHQLSSTGNAYFASGAGSVGIGVIPSGTYKLEVNGSVGVTDEAYGSGWNGSLQVPTKNAVYDKFESMAESWVMLTADYTLSNVATEQKAFNTTTNGTLTLPTGVYAFEWFAYLTTMSATSGNASFDPVGAGTAVTDRWGQHAQGIDNSTPLAVGARSGSASVTQQLPASAVTAATDTGMVATITGLFRVSTAGTIIPSVTLATAAAAVMKAGSYFRIRRLGDSTVTSVGSWT